MANAVITRKAKNKMLKARAGEKALAKIVGMAFGDGGVQSGGQVRVPTETQTSLNNELLRKAVTGHQMLSEIKCRYECVLAANELTGKNISEIALYDQDGDLVAIKNFLPKGKDSDLEMVFRIDDEFI